MLSTIKILIVNINYNGMPETVETDDPAEKVNNLSDSELEERFERDLENFKDKLKKYSSE